MAAPGRRGERKKEGGPGIWDSSPRGRPGRLGRGGGGGRARGGGGASASRQSPPPPLRAPEGGREEIEGVREFPAQARDVLAAPRGRSSSAEGAGSVSLKAGPQPRTGGVTDVRGPRSNSLWWDLQRRVVPGIRPSGLVGSRRANTALEEGGLCLLPFPQKNGDLELEGTGMKLPPLLGLSVALKAFSHNYHVSAHYLIIPNVCNSFTVCTVGSQTRFGAVV